MSSPAPPPPIASPPGVRAGAWVALALIPGVMLAGLRGEGRRWWCALGDPAPWTSGIGGEHTSQHLLDPYSFTHLLHGVGLYAILWLVARRWRWDVRLVAALALECLWEVVENSDRVIDRYRAATIALGYAGDSVGNSLGDAASCALGFWLARRLPVRCSIALFLAVEVALLAIYRDNLLLNMLMLLHPFEAIRAWQGRG